jgi:hypothetical protein
MSRIQAYPIEYSEDRLRYRFVSKGIEGDIVKLIRYECIDEIKWNLAFGDANADESDFDDVIVSNNGDMRRIIQTLFLTSLIFSEAYPNRKIYIEPIDRRRCLLYNRVFQDQQKEIEAYFVIYGVLPKRSKPDLFDPKRIYNSFILTRKIIL